MDTNFHSDNWGQENSYGDVPGILQGYIFQVYPESHRADIMVYEHGGEHLLPNVRVGSGWTGGPNTGIHALPRVGTPVQVLLKRPNQRYWSQGSGRAEVIGVNFGSENEPPKHISQKGEKNYYVFQSHISDGEDVSPGSIDLWDDKGGKHSLMTSKGTNMSMGVDDARAKGISLTSSEKKCMDAANTLAVAAQKADAINNLASTTAGAQDLQTMGQGFASMAQDLEAGHRAMSESGDLFGTQIQDQTSAFGVANNATGLAMGSTSIDHLGS